MNTDFLLPCMSVAMNNPAVSGPDLTYRMMSLMLQLGVIIFAARIGNQVFHRFRLPPVLGELCAGILVGPYILGAIPLPFFPQGLFYFSTVAAVGEISISPELYGISSLAAVTMLFAVGLETDLKLFLRFALAGACAGIGGVILSFIAGTWITTFFSLLVLGREIAWNDPASLMMGVIFTATSVGITARVLAEKKQIDSPEGVTILAGAVVDDVIGVILLAIVLGLAALSPGNRVDINWNAIAGVAIKTLVFWLIAMVIGLIAARGIGSGLKLFRHHTVIAVMALGLSMIVAGLFEAAGLAMIVGAYVTGLSLSQTDLRNVILERLRLFNTMLTPVFFAVMGMLVDVRLLLNPVILAVGLLFALVSLPSKLLGCGLPSLLAGFNLRGGLRIGSGMVPRGEVTLLMSGAGLAAGLINSELLGIVVIMTLFSSLTAPILIHLSFRWPGPGLRKPPPPVEEREIVFPFPSPAINEIFTGKLIACFEHEGFYVHRLSREESLFQMRKDNTVIGFKKHDSSVAFRCKPGALAFIQTAMAEVVAELENTLGELRKPFDAGSLRLTDTPEKDSTGGVTPAQVGLRSYLKPSLMCPHLKASTREGVIKELLDIISQVEHIANRKAVLDSILERERNLSTGLQNGIALPHTRNESVKKLVCAIGIKSGGVDFASPDGLPARIIVLTLAPKKSGVPYLQFISTISRVLNDQGRSALLACDTAEEMFALLTGRHNSGRRIIPSFRGRRHDVSYGKWLVSERMLLNPDAADSAEVINSLLDLCQRTGAIPSVGEERTEIEKREKIMSTAVGHGIALPHIRTDKVKTLTCAVAILGRGIEFNSPDGLPVRIVVLTLIPPGSTLDYPRLLAGLMRALDANGREAVLQAESAEEAARLLAGEQVEAAKVNREND